MSAEEAAHGADSFAASGSNIGKKAVHVKVCRYAISFLIVVFKKSDEIECIGHHY